MLFLFSAKKKFFNMRYIISVDVGTTHCKAISVGENGMVANMFKENVSSIHDVPGQHEQDAEIIFQSVISLLQQSFKANRENEIAAVSFSAAMHGLLAVDENGVPLTNIITWADTRSKDHASQLIKSDAGNIIYQRTGTPIHPMSPLCKLMWMKNEIPEIFEKAHKFISIKEYIFYRLFGKYIIDHSIASGTGLFDVYHLNWFDGSLHAAGIDALKLSTPVACTHAETLMQQEFQQLLKIQNSIPFIVGGSDGCLANFGSGAILPGEVALTIGTSGAVRMITQNPKPDEQKRLFTYILTEKIFVTGGPINNGGIALQWFAENFLQQTGNATEKIKAALDLAALSKPGAERLLFLPYLQGERAPIWDANAKAIFFGAHSLHNKEHFARAVVEGICFALNDVLKALEELNGPCSKIYISGGFIESAFWVQLLADILGKRLVISNTADASAMGAAFMAMYALGIIQDPADIKKIIREENVFEPDEKKHELYLKMFSVYRSLYPKLKDNFTALDEL